MLVAGNCVLEATNFDLTDLHLPCQHDPIQLHTFEKEAKSDHPFPLFLLVLTVKEPLSEDLC